MDKNRSVGITVFSIFIVISSLLFFLLAFHISNYKYLYKPLPEIIIQIRYFVGQTMAAVGFISGIGLFARKDFFRKAVLANSFYTLYRYIIEGPFFIFKNTILHTQQLLSISESPTAYLNHEGIRQGALVTIFVWIIDFSFAICVIYFFTRLKVKEQFK